MRAKMMIHTVNRSTYSEELKMSAVTSGSDEDNSYSEATPSADLTMQISNKELWGKFNPGESYYLDFTKTD